MSGFYVDSFISKRSDTNHVIKMRFLPESMRLDECIIPCILSQLNINIIQVQCHSSAWRSTLKFHWRKNTVSGALSEIFSSNIIYYTLDDRHVFEHSSNNCRMLTRLMVVEPLLGTSHKFNTSRDSSAISTAESSISLISEIWRVSSNFLLILHQKILGIVVFLF